MLAHMNNLSRAVVRRGSSRVARTRAASRSGCLSALTCVALWVPGAGAATPAALDESAIKQLAMPVVQAEPQIDNSAPTPASEPANATAPAVPELERRTAVGDTASARIDIGADSPVSARKAPQTVESNRKAYAGQPAPLDINIIRGLAMPASTTVIESSGAGPAAAAQDSTQRPEPTRRAQSPLADPPTEPRAAAPRPTASTELDSDDVSTAVRRTGSGQPVPLDAGVIGGLARDVATPAPALRPLPPAQMNVVRDTFAPEMRP